MQASQEAYSRAFISHLLMTHGFRPEMDQDAWSKSSRTQDAIAELDNDRSRLHLMIYNSPDDQLIFETNIDLSATNEPVLEKVISTFDLS